MKLFYFTIFSAVLFINPALILAQNDVFKDFRTTQAEGKSPAIFTTSFNDKVAESIENNKKIDKEIRADYAKYSTYALNNLLNSGFVLYGDPMTKYVEKVAANLLKNEPGLRRRLQFYVLKTNTTNALCVEPGIIFITTGLLSQIENEAQLAYIIAHEIVHYQEKHLQQSFTKSKENELKPESAYENLVSLSKNHEFEADKNALKLYHEAGYSEEEVNTVFDVLMYSYLSFDEIKIDSSFFGNPNIYIPQSLFPEKANPILAFEDYDDSKSTHPNIRRRKEAIAKEIKNYENWGNNNHFLNEEEFNTIQTTARFQSIRENLLEANYIEALYEIYILEKEFQDNEYLQTNKALAWASINQNSSSGRKRRLTKDLEMKEGNISLLYGFFDNLNQIELALLSLRQIQDVYKEFPSSKRIKEIRDETILSLSKLRNLKIENLEGISFRAAQKIASKTDNDTVANDRKEIDSAKIENETKYDRIRRIRENQNAVNSFSAELTDTNFSLFLLYDLAKKGEFIELYNQGKNRQTRSRVVRYNNERTMLDENDLKKSDVILIQPQLIAKTQGNFDLDETLKFNKYLILGIEKHAPHERFINNDLSVEKNFSTAKYNEVAIINAYLIQRTSVENRDFNNLWVDYDQINNLLIKYQNPYILIINGEYYYDKFTSKAVTGNGRYIRLSTGEVYGSREYDSRYKLGKLSVEGLAHLIFSKFN